VLLLLSKRKAYTKSKACTRQGKIGKGGAEAPSSYFDPALGHHEPRPSICFKSGLILVTAIHSTKPNTNDDCTHELVNTAPEGR